MPVSDSTSSSSSSSTPLGSLLAAFKINDNIDGWGPNFLPDQFKDLPYQKFSKSDRIGKVKSIKV